MELTRRNFLKGIGVAGVGVAAASVAVGCSTGQPQPSSAAKPDQTTEGNQYINSQCAGYDVYSASAFEPVAIADSDIAETIEADVIIVGAGIGGGVAAATCVDEGKSVIILQKDAAPLSHGWGIGACNSTLQKEQGVDVDWQKCLNKWRRDNENRCDYALTNTWLAYSGETVDYIYSICDSVEGAGPMLQGFDASRTYDDEYSLAYPTVHGWTGEMRGVATALIDYAVNSGKADVHYSTPAIQLVVNDNGAVIGAIGKNKDGEYIKCLGGSVIMSAGDYGNNPGLRARYMPHIEGLPSAYSTTSNTGDGQLMMMAIGGQMQLAPHTGNIHYDPPVGVPDICGSGIPFLRVNTNGKRFSNEDVSYGQLYAQDMLQPNKFHFQVFDSTYPDYYANMGHGMMRDEPNADFSGIEKGIENGDVLSGDSVEELAGKMGVPAEELKKTIDRYNECCDAGEDLDYGKNPQFLHHIDTPPFLAVKRQVGLLCSLNGVVTNPDMQALDNDGAVIKGLYVTGNCQGNWFGGLEHPMGLPGMSLGRATLTARVAAKRACGANY